jgi:8-oxo-dGTP pyrophosphatase MutT (NUDIX family)
LSRYHEWTFVTGGCRRREVFNPLRCAVRELEEETRGTINLKRGSYAYFKFITNTPEPRDIEDGVDVINYYHVYVFDLPMTVPEHKHIVKRFDEEKEKMEGTIEKSRLFSRKAFPGLGIETVTTWACMPLPFPEPFFV